MVYRSSIACLFTVIVLGKDDKMSKVLQEIIKQKVTKMKLVSKLIDKVNEEERIDKAKEEGGDATMTASTAFQDSLEEIVDHTECRLGSDSFGIEPGSKAQAALYNVLDNEDHIVPGVGLFNCCTHCGLAFSAKLWWNRDEGAAYDPKMLGNLDVNKEAFEAKTSQMKAGQHYWRCLLEWKQLEQAMLAEKASKRADGPACQMWKHMIENFGDDWKTWPISGCGRGFKAYGRGPSMILEMEVEADNHVSLLAERPPEILNMAFKEAKIVAWKVISANLNLVELFDWLSNTFPMDKEFGTKGWNGKSIKGVNSFPLEKWNETNREFMTTKSWIRFAFFLAAGHDSVAMNDLRQLAHGVEDEDDAKELANGNLGKVKVLKMAANKLYGGNPAPATHEAVKAKGPVFGYSTALLGKEAPVIA